jgi:hypothetical protein
MPTIPDLREEIATRKVDLLYIKGMVSLPLASEFAVFGAMFMRRVEGFIAMTGSENARSPPLLVRRIGWSA